MSGTHESPRTPRSMTGIESNGHGHHIAPDLLLSRADAARALAIGERKLAEITSNGAIPSVKIGARRLYPTDGLRDWIARGCPEGGEA